MFIPLKDDNPTARIPYVTILFIALNAVVFFYLTLVFLFFFIRIIAVPAAFVLGIWILIQVLNIGAGGGVAWFAHIGGFLIGIALIKVFTKRQKPQVWVH